MSMIYENKFSKGVKVSRERARLTIPQAAERIGTSSKMIEWWEKGERTPNLRIFYTICAAYECCPNDLLQWPDTTHRKLEFERDSLLSAMRAIVACGLNCKDALDEAEQMERIAKEALSSANVSDQTPAARDSDTTDSSSQLSASVLFAIIERIEGLVDWHADLEADIEDPSPEDSHAHCNGLVLQACKEARAILENVKVMASADEKTPPKETTL